jgi:hypothetical protein
MSRVAGPMKPAPSNSALWKERPAAEICITTGVIASLYFTNNICCPTCYLLVKICYSHAQDLTRPYGPSS